MNHVSYCKLLYLIYTPFQNVRLRLGAVKCNGLVFCCGRLSFFKHKSARLSIGKNCRFVSKEIGNKLGLNHRCILSVENGGELYIGDSCSFSGVSIRCYKNIRIGNHVRMGANCLLLDGDGHQDDPRSGANKPIQIDDNVWIGGGVVVKKGVRIGRNSVIGLNSVVAKDIPENCVAIGNPCRVVRSFSDSEIIEIEKYYL